MTKIATHISVRGRKSSPFSPSFPFPGVTYFLALSVLLSSSMPTALKLESATAKKNPFSAATAKRTGFSSREQELSMG